MEDVHEFAKVDLPEEVIKEGGVAGLRAGADTSALITKSGKVWSWGNSVSKGLASCVCQTRC